MAELCRKCGESLNGFLDCLVCRESLQMICSVCKKITEEIHHQNCSLKLHILKLFPPSPDLWFETYKKNSETTRSDPYFKILEITSKEKSNAITAIAKVLEDISRPALEQVCYIIRSNHKCYLIDCYDNPEFIAEALKELFGRSYQSIIERIENSLKDYKPKDSIQQILATIKSTL